MKTTSRLHDSFVHNRRVRVLQQHLSALLPAEGKVLDVGCGDGLLAHGIGQRLPECAVHGIDVLVRGETHIPVEAFNGNSIPYEDDSFDSVLFVDVLHHTDDPMRLLREAVRVARRSIVIKGHTKNGFMADQTVRFMDRIGNAHHGVALPYNYWSQDEWEKAFKTLNLNIDVWQSRLGLYPAPADWLFGRKLHFVARGTVAMDLLGNAGVI